MLCISNDIFYKSQEVLKAQTTAEIADNLANFLVTIPAVKFSTPFINWNLVTIDKDDNKFVDCAISASTECVITNDAHFNILKTVSFPTVKILTPEEFEKFYKL